MRIQQLNAMHRPPNQAPEKYCHIPSRMKRKATTWPTGAAIRVERSAFFVIAQTIERSTRPPSSGKPGIRLKTARETLIYPHQKSTALTAVGGWGDAAQPRQRPLARQARP